MIDYFASAASYYAQYRPFYPEALVGDIADFFRLTKDNRVLDIGSGTGQLAIQLSRFCKEVVAVEVDADMIEEGKKLCQQHSVENIRWVHSGAEDLPAESGLGQFRLASFGASFHWMPHEKLLRFLDTIIEPDGGVAVAGSRSIWMGEDVWEQIIKEIVQRYLGEERRAGTGKYKEATNRDETFEEILKHSPFSTVEERAYSTRRTQTLDEVIGRLYSTSFANPAVLGDKRESLELELRDQLLKIEPSGIFEKIDPYYLFLAKR
jgi:ubiquinone/menaquinone biosynthesis C-methylase UbiE